MTAWTRPEDIIANLHRRWQRGELLAARVTGERLFPLELPLERPTAEQAAERAGDVAGWIEALHRGSREHRGRGYVLRWQNIGDPAPRSGELPVAVTIPAWSDALFLLDQQRATERFDALAAQTLERFPALSGWLAGHAMRALAHADDWSAILRVLDFFARHPRPGVYLRQLDIPDVDSRFIEARQDLLGALLDVLLPAGMVDVTARGAGRFARRYGLRSEPARMRFRLLDRPVDLQGLTDLSVPVDELARLDPAVSRVFVTESLTNGLCMPDCPSSLVVFDLAGEGSSFEHLAEIPWLDVCDVWYWGDIDTRGFGILERLRVLLPHIRSLLMDRETLLAHRALWDTEPAEGRYGGNPQRLTADEQALYDDLRADRLGERVRLGQERIGYGWVQRALADALDSPAVSERGSGSRA